MMKGERGDWGGNKQESVFGLELKLQAVFFPILIFSMVMVLNKNINITAPYL